MRLSPAITRWTIKANATFARTSSLFDPATCHVLFHLQSCLKPRLEPDLPLHGLPAGRRRHGGLLYGIDVGIIAGALPYLEATASTQWHLNAQQLSFIVAAVLLGSVLSSLLAGAIADLWGRRAALLLAGALFCASIPVIAMASGYIPLLLGRLLQGISGGLIGVVAPLYLAECLSPQWRGRGTALFQLLLTLGLVAAALVGLFYAQQVEDAARHSGAAALLALKDDAWRSIFWCCLPPGLAFTFGVLKLGESPRWLARRGRRDEARTVLLRSRSPAQADSELADIDRAQAMAAAPSAPGARRQDSLLSRRYSYPFLLACLILACNQATGINSILAYAVTILNQAGLPGAMANLGDVAIKTLNAVMTVVALVLVDRKGRRFLLMLGSSGIAISLMLAGLLFQTAERGGSDVRAALQMRADHDGLTLALTPASLHALGAPALDDRAVTLNVAYSYGGFSNVQALRIERDGGIPVLRIMRTGTVAPDNVIGQLFRRLGMNPFPDPALAAGAPLRIDKATAAPVPAPAQGWLVAACIVGFIASFAVGPGVCVWLALAELMPTRIRSSGMSIALLVNQFVSTVIAGMFLPTVGQYGYASMFYFWAGCAVLYFMAAAFLLPETKGKTLEEIERHFAR
ncbi:MFS transporter [Pseudoduganella lutea]|uniref:MFS transporter n=1 Tax=Pseudoduganella lutea TaxID=321985 RepID=A0A4P6KZ04_9BURK|nr:MFS transporter [Pseudoduganella lutea]QBE63548.1 MFS transporter [Pseudoduganella lutea]